MPYELSVDSASNDGFNGTLEFDTKHFDPNYATIMELSLEV